MTYEPKTELGKRLQKNTKWLYFNGGRYWSGYKKAVPRYSLAVSYTHLDVYKRQAKGSDEVYAALGKALPAGMTVLAKSCLLYTSRCV